MAWQALKEFVAGGVGGMSLTFVGYPLDTAKVKLQTAPVGTYSGMLDCMTKTIRTQGPLGLYKGMGPPLASQPFVFAVYFWGFGQGKVLCKNAGLVKEVSAEKGGGSGGRRRGDCRQVWETHAPSMGRRTFHLILRNATQCNATQRNPTTTGRVSQQPRNNACRRLLRHSGDDSDGPRRSDQGDDPG